MQIETQYADSGGHSIAYQVLGGGPIDVLFVQGMISHLDRKCFDTIGILLKKGSGMKLETVHCR